mmetsp:Transcript_45107/g.130242  ORF Transcript_45107/g.130242 Transcript_45107/m.130242 type:complete len:215 (-) Transcript_45107:4471-5115(-)
MMSTSLADRTLMLWTRARSCATSSSTGKRWSSGQRCSKRLRPRRRRTRDTSRTPSTTSTRTLKRTMPTPNIKISSPATTTGGASSPKKEKWGAVPKALPAKGSKLAKRIKSLNMAMFIKPSPKHAVGKNACTTHIIALPILRVSLISMSILLTWMPTEPKIVLSINTPTNAPPPEVKRKDNTYEFTATAGMKSSNNVIVALMAGKVSHCSEPKK